jgi:hypothetical protein
MQKIVVISDLEHSSPRISNILYFLNQNKYEKYWIGANPEHFVNKKDLPNGFEKKIKNLFFRRRINIFQFIKQFLKSIRGNKKNGSISFSGVQKKNKLIIYFLSILIPDQYVFTTLKYVVKFRNEFKNGSKIIILSSSPYSTVHLACYIIKTIYKKRVVWVADYRDLWSLNHNYPFSKFRLLIDKKIEKTVIKKACLVTTTTLAWSKKQSKFLNRKVNVIYNGFSFPDINQVSNYSLERENNKKYILYVGSLYTTFQDYELLFDNLDNKHKNYEIHFLGKPNNIIKEIVELKKLDNIIKNIGYFNRNDAMLIQKQYDYLLFFDSKQDEGILPLKFYEYINANKPIICVGGKSKSEPKQILNYLKRGIILEERNQLKDFFDKIHFKQNGLHYEEEKNYEFSYKFQSQKFEELLDEYLVSYNW